jgi:hypothetical protein
MNMVTLSLSGVVSVNYEVYVVDAEGHDRRIVASVDFPDETRSMLEAVTWDSRVVIEDFLDRIASAYLTRLFEAGFLSAAIARASLSTQDPGKPAVATVHPSVEYLRSSLRASFPGGSA